MTPTNELRFVEREVYDETTDFNGHTVRVLQQKWVDLRGDYKPEWRDVSIEKEPKQ